VINNLSIIMCDTCKTPGPAAYTGARARAAAAANGWQTFRSRLSPGDVCPTCRADTEADGPTPSPLTRQAASTTPRRAVNR
jgi:hypothetical protein